MSAPRILLIDSYDSFTNNLAALLNAAVPSCKVNIIRNNSLHIEQLAPLLHYFHAVVVGPGPGSPGTPSDVGVIPHLWRLSSPDLLPIFGVCLGMQSLALENGAQLHRLNVVKHGQISQLEHDGTGLFKGVDSAHVVRYHSLHVSVSNGTPIEVLGTADDGEENGRVLMAIRHRHKPFWGVQYHPESTRTTGGGLDVLKNFWRLASAWSALHDRAPRPWNAAVEDLVGGSWPLPQPVTLDPEQDNAYRLSKMQIPGLCVHTLCERIGAHDEDAPFVLLESAAHPGRYSIIGCLDRSSPRLQHTVGDAHISMAGVSEPLGAHDVWSWLSDFMRRRRVTGGPQEVPFWGGLIGYLGYELGVHGLTSLEPRAKAKQRPHPDVNLAFVERSIVIDRHTDTVYIQTLRKDDDLWLRETESLLLACPESGAPAAKPVFAKQPTVVLPDEKLYKARIRLAQDHLLAGDSYELCLTARTRVFSTPIATPSPSSSSWALYKALQRNNPAPHAGYIRLAPSTLLSSSPERFLSFSRAGRCEMRPIKGTVRKAPGITRAVAEELLSGSKKEVAENLMIVDLIRHDLHGVVGDDVEVRQFCKVEEYETVWQMVSVIEGGPPGSADEATGSPTNGLCTRAPLAPSARARPELGWEVLKQSLPPGSMTGAPKKRSVEILRSLEDDDRSVYSGVFGFMDVGGGGDWAVVIRSCFKYERRGGNGAHADAPAREPECGRAGGEQEQEWLIGAGGAITALSDPQSEWEEMVTKLQSVLRTFSSAAL